MTMRCTELTDQLNDRTAELTDLEIDNALKEVEGESSSTTGEVQENHSFKPRCVLSNYIIICIYLNNTSFFMIIPFKCFVLFGTKKVYLC